MTTHSPSSGVIRRLYGLTLPYRRTIFAGMACLIIAVGCELYPPLIWQQVVDHGLVTQDWTFIGWQLALMTAVFAVGQVFSAIRGVLLERAGQALARDLRQELYQKLQRQSPSYYARNRSGDLLSRLIGDIEGVQDVLVRGTDSILANALRLLGVAAIFIWLQPLLGVIVLVPMVVVGVLLTRYNQEVRPVYRAARARLGGISARLSDNLSGMRVIQSFAQERRESAALASQSQELYADRVAAVILRNRAFPVVRWIAQLSNVLMLGGGIWLILRGQFTIGGLVAYRGYGRYFYGPIDDLVSINDLLQSAEASGQRLFEVLDAPEEIQNAPNSIVLPTPLRGEVRFEGVWFSYESRPDERPTTNDQPRKNRVQGLEDTQHAAQRTTDNRQRTTENYVLHDVSLQINPGERVAILGASGAGKSTLLALVARLYDPNAGRVLIDGHDIRHVTLESLRSQIGQVQQETFLFNASVIENLRYGREDAAYEEIEAAARAANAHGFISALPKGYDTVVGERGVKLSGGQKQRLAVARALLANTPLLVLDEPTSAVEPESEAAIIEALERLMQGRTTLIVSHRLSLARNADRVIIVANGGIAEQGSPNQLLGDESSRFTAMVRADNAFVLDEV